MSFVEQHGLWTLEQVVAAEEIEHRVKELGLRQVRIAWGDQHGILRGKNLEVGHFLSTLRSGKDFQFPLRQELRENSVTDPFTGGSAVAGPDGTWLIEPVTGEGLIVADLDLRAVRRERLTFDPTGHYSRPDVFSTHVNRQRPQPVTITDSAAAPGGGEEPS
jgi:hypothetical protein